MKIKKLGWLAAMLAVAAMIGAVGLSPQSASANHTLAGLQKVNCTPGALNAVTECDLVLTGIQNLNAGEIFTVTIAGGTFAPGQNLQVLELNNGGNAVGNCVGTATTPPGGGNITISFAGVGCPAVATVRVVNERFTITNPAGAQQTVAGVPSNIVLPQAAPPVQPITVATVNKPGCVGGQLNATTTCNLTIGGIANVPAAGGQISVGITGGTFVAPVPTVTTNVATCIATAAIAGGGTSLTLTLAGAGCAGVNTVTVAGENFQITNPGGAFQTVIGIQSQNILPAGAPAVGGLTAQKNCTQTAAQLAANTASCTLTLTVTNAAIPAGELVTVGLAGGAAFSLAAGAQTVGGTCAVILDGVQAAQLRVVAPVGGCAVGSTIIINETLAVSATGAVIQTATRANGQFAVGNANVVFTPAPFNPAVTVLTLQNCINRTIDVSSAAPVIIGCRIDLSDNGTVTERVSSGIIRITIGRSGGFADSTSTNPIFDNLRCVNGSGVTCSVGADGHTMTVRCGAENTQDTCDFVDFEIEVRASDLALSTDTVVRFTVDASYTPDNPALNTPQNLNVADAFRVRRVIAVTGCVNPFAIRLSASTSVFGVSNPATLLQTLRPGELGGGAFGEVLAVGVLPGSVSVTATAVDALGNPVNVCPGTFEVSSLNGSLLDLSGNVTTNLRIACGGTAANLNLSNPFGVGAINLNSCQGVTFAVLGLGVGVVDLIVRYEPLNETLCAGGCREVEVRGAVGFVAPVARVTLRLDPNPVAVGATTTAIADLTTLYSANCTAINPGQGLLNVASSLCIDPATGRVITSFSDPGSRLNGFVMFAVENTAIARFQEAGIATAGTTLNIGVTGTASQVVRECGAFSGGRNTTNPFSLILDTAASGPLAPYFGGCTEARATLVGVNPGSVNVSATFFPFLPGAAASTLSTFGINSSTVLGAGLVSGNFFAPGVSNSSSVATLQVAGVAPTGNVQLVRGCNNVTPTVTEAASAYAARVTPANVVIAVWEHQAATNTFLGAPGAASPASAQAVADLSTVTRLRPVFVCVTAPATLAQPAI